MPEGESCLSGGSAFNDDEGSQAYESPDPEMEASECSDGDREFGEYAEPGRAKNAAQRRRAELRLADIEKKRDPEHQPVGAEDLYADLDEETARRLATSRERREKRKTDRQINKEFRAPVRRKAQFEVPSAVALSNRNESKSSPKPKSRENIIAEYEERCAQPGANPRNAFAYLLLQMVSNGHYSSFSQARKDSYAAAEAERIKKSSPAVVQRKKEGYGDAAEDADESTSLAKALGIPIQEADPGDSAAKAQHDYSHGFGEDPDFTGIPPEDGYEARDQGTHAAAQEPVQQAHYRAKHSGLPNLSAKEKSYDRVKLVLSTDPKKRGRQFLSSLLRR